MTILYSEYLSKKYAANIYLKPEWLGPTGSHKDKWALSALSFAKQRGHKKVVVMSSGNLGLALAAAAKKEHFECIIITWDSLPSEYVTLFSQYDARLIQVADADEEMMEFKKHVADGFFPLSLTSLQRETMDLPGIEGYERTAQEILMELPGQPDMIIVPAAFGDFAEGILRGFEKLDDAIPLPKFILVRATPEANLARSILVSSTSPYVQRVLMKTCGRAIFLKNEDFLSAQKETLDKIGFHIELTSAGVIAALEHLSTKEIKNKTIVLLLTALAR